jgi:PAS domain S-box-containing protein
MDQPSDINYHAIFTNAPVGMCVAVDRVIVASNGALDEMFGYRTKALHGCSFSVLYPTMDEFVRTGDRVMAVLDQQGRYADERIMRRHDGDLFWCHVTGCRLGVGNAPAQTVWTFEDVSTTRPVTARLTPREREIATFLVEGKTSKVIARAIKLSPRTVEMHRARMMKKLGAATALELAYRLASAAP